MVKWNSPSIWSARNPPRSEHLGKDRTRSYTNSRNSQVQKIKNTPFAELLLREYIPLAILKCKLWLLKHWFAAQAARYKLGRFLNLYAWDPSPEILLFKKKSLHQGFWHTARIENAQPGLRITDLDYGESLYTEAGWRSEPWLQEETSQSRSAWQVCRKRA